MVEFLKEVPSIRFMALRRWWYAISAIVVVASILFGALILAGREIQPSGVPAMIQGIILFCLIIADVFVRYRVVITRRATAPA